MVLSPFLEPALSIPMHARGAGATEAECDHRARIAVRPGSRRGGADEGFGIEIDLIVDTPAGPHAVEIKSGETVAGDFFKGLTCWPALAGRSLPATLVYGGSESYVRNGVDVRAWRNWV